MYICDFLGVGFTGVSLCSVTIYCNITPKNTLNMKLFWYGQVCGCLFWVWQSLPISCIRQRKLYLENKLLFKTLQKYNTIKNGYMPANHKCCSSVLVKRENVWLLFKLTFNMKKEEKNPVVLSCFHCCFPYLS